MSDWSVGDRAICVDGGCCSCCGSKFFADNAAFTVTGVLPFGEELYLSFAEVAAPHHSPWWEHSAFRKARPDAHEKCEDEFITLLKRRRVNA